MAFADVTEDYVNVLTNDKHATRTADTAEFNALKDQYSVYLNPNTNFLPDRKYTRGLALLIAHHYALDDTTAPDTGSQTNDQNVGSVSNESVGDVSIGYGGLPTFNSTDSWNSWLAKTRYGTEFIYLMKTFKSVPFVT